MEFGVIADDFAAVGFGDTFAEASRDLDKNLEAVLRRCEDRGMRLNLDKVQLRKQEVPFIGHVATSRGVLTRIRCEPLWRCLSQRILQLYSVYWVSPNTSASSFPTSQTSRSL